MDSLKSMLNPFIANKKILTFGLFSFLILSLPLIVFVLQKQTQVRQQAATATTVTLTPVVDTFVDKDSPNTAYGSNTALKVNGETNEKISYFKFDLTPLAGKTITSAKLSIMVTDKSAETQRVKSVTNVSWSGSITYNNRPPLGTVITTFSNTALNAWKDILLTNEVNAKKGQLFAIAIDADDSDLLVFKSKEASSDRPKLVVTYTTSPTNTPVPSKVPTATPKLTSFPTITAMPTKPLSVTPVPSTPPVGGSCPAVATDTMLLIDRSQSMNGKASSTDTRTKFAAAKTGAVEFVNTFPPSSNTLLGLVTFGSTENSMIPSVAKQLSSDYAGLKATISSLQIDSKAGTCMECAIVNASNELTARGRSGIKKVFVLLTDGRALSTINRPYNTNPGADVSEAAAMTAAQNAFNQHKVTIYVIGLGANVNALFLQRLASLSGGKYYFPGSSENLAAIYNEIAIALSKGSVQGVVYDDANGNGAMDTTEGKLSGWTVQVKTSTGAPVASSTSDTTGTFTVSNLCNGSYTLTQTLKSGWRQTQPANNEGYAITITNGFALDNKNFGNTKAARCSDTEDNDSNGYIDTNDSSCHTDGDPENPDSYDPKKDGENGSGNTCADSKDNNNNGLIDGGDPICHTDGDPGNPATYNPDLPETSLPDLVVTNKQVTYDKNGTSWVCETGLGLLVTLKNTGEGIASGPFAVKANNTVKTFNGNIAAGANATIWIDTVTGNGTSTAIVDVMDQVDESDETNNELSSPDLLPTQPLQCISPTLTLSPTPDNQDTVFDLTVFLHGIGSSGDNRNPASDLSNKNPLHPDRKAFVQVFNNTNQLVASSEALIKYASASGNFLGTVNMGKVIINGNYTVKVKTEQHLRNQYPGIFAITAGQTVTLPAISLVSGDVNGDNKLDILDYNILHGCYTSDFIQTPRNCNAENKLKADLDDEGQVNLYDLNLFIRELSVQSGL